MKKRLLSLILALAMLLSMVSMVAFAENPYKYAVVSSGAFDFEDYTIEGSSIKDSNGNSLKMFDGKTGVVVYGAGTGGVAVVSDPDPAGTHGDVLMIPNTTAYNDRCIDARPGIPKGLIYDTENNKFVIEFDYYVNASEASNGKDTSAQLVYAAVFPDGETDRAKREFVTFAYAKTNASGETFIGTGSSSVAIDDSTWVHVVVVWDVDGYTSLYVDGEEVAEEVKNIKGSYISQIEYVRVNSAKADDGIVHYVDNWHYYEASDVACVLSADGYVAGETGIEEEITFSVVDNTGEGYDIYYSTDGSTWDIYSDTSYVLTLTPVYFKAVTKSTGAESNEIELVGERLPLEISYDGPAGSTLIEYQEVDIKVSGTRDENLDLEYSTDGNRWTKFNVARPEDKTVKYTVKAGDNYIRMEGCDTVLEILGVAEFTGTTLSCNQDISSKNGGDAVSIDVSTMIGDTTIYVSKDGEMYEAYTTIPKAATSFNYTLTAGDNYLKAGKDGEVLVLEGIGRYAATTLWDVDFEDKDGYSYTYNETATTQEPIAWGNEAGSSAMTSPNGKTFEIVPEWNVSEKDVATTHIVAAPEGYKNSDGIGAKAIKFQGEGNEAPNATNIRVFFANENSSPEYGETIVFEFSFAIDNFDSDKVNSSIHLGGFRTKRGGSTTYINYAVSKSGKLTFDSADLNQVIEPKTWYNVKSIINVTSGVIDTYINEELIHTLNSGKTLGSVDSFRHWGTGKKPAQKETIYFDNFRARAGKSEVIAQPIGEAVVGADGKSFTVSFDSAISTVPYLGLTPAQIAENFVELYNGSNKLVAKTATVADDKMSITITTEKSIYTSVDIIGKLYLDKDKIDSICLNFKREAVSYDVEEVDIAEDENGYVTATATVQNLDPIETKTMIMLLTVANADGVVEEVYFQEATLQPESQDVSITIANKPASGKVVKVFFCDGWTSLAPVKAVVYEK